MREDPRLQRTGVVFVAKTKIVLTNSITMRIKQDNKASIFNTVIHFRKLKFYYPCERDQMKTFFNVKGSNVLHNDINISSQIALTFSCCSYLFFNWWIAALPCCVSFCCSKVNQLYKHIYPLFPGSPSHSRFSRSSQSTELSSLYSGRELPHRYLFHT